MISSPSLTVASMMSWRGAMDAMSSLDIFRNHWIIEGYAKDPRTDNKHHDISVFDNSYLAESPTYLIDVHNEIVDVGESAEGLPSSVVMMGGIETTMRLCGTASMSCDA